MQSLTAAGAAVDTALCIISGNDGVSSLRTCAVCKDCCGLNAPEREQSLYMAKGTERCS